MLAVLFSKESATYSREALEVSHFSGTDPGPEDSVLESEVFWEGQLLYRDLNRPVLLSFHMGLQ